MKKQQYLLLIVFLLTLLVVNPVLAAPGGNGGNGNSNSASSNSTKGGGNEKSVKADNSSEGQDTVNNVKSDKTSVNVEKKAKNIVLNNMTDKQITAAREEIAQKRNESKKTEFKDTKEHWAQNSISKAQSLGLISGYQDGSFQPDSPVTSAEAMVMAVSLAETLGIDELVQEDTSSEIPTDQTGDTTSEAAAEDTTVSNDVPKWAEGKAKIASELGIININRFHSATQANRVQTAVMLAKALNLDPMNTADTSFSDSILISPEDLGYILALKEAGIIFGSTDGKFNPNSSITRAEIAAMLGRAVETVDDDEETSETPATNTSAESATDTGTNLPTDSTSTPATETSQSVTEQTPLVDNVNSQSTVQ